MTRRPPVPAGLLIHRIIQLCQLQDLGRRSYQNYGVNRSGAMDPSQLATLFAPHRAQLPPVTLDLGAYAAMAPPPICTSGTRPVAAG